MIKFKNLQQDSKHFTSHFLLQTIVLLMILKFIQANRHLKWLLLITNVYVIDNSKISFFHK